MLYRSEMQSEVLEADFCKFNNFAALNNAGASYE